ncbi:hypothetical protein OIU78_012190 [Salix suchowensis]|nr:hypothetical protein OIU78_012190 [Salix suchowensis]
MGTTRQCIIPKFNSRLNTIIKCTGHHHPAPSARRTIMATLCKLQGQLSLDLRLNECLDRLIYTSQRPWKGSFSSFPSPTIQPTRHPFPSSSTAAGVIPGGRMGSLDHVDELSGYLYDPNNGSM